MWKGKSETNADLLGIVFRVVLEIKVCVSIMSGQIKPLQLHPLLETWGLYSGLESEDKPYGYPLEAPSSLATFQHQFMSESSAPMPVFMLCSIWIQFSWPCLNTKPFLWETLKLLWWTDPRTAKSRGPFWEAQINACSKKPKRSSTVLGWVVIMWFSLCSRQDSHFCAHFSASSLMHD